MEKLIEGTVLAVGSHTATIVKYLSEGGFSHIYEVTIDPKEDDSEIACLKRVIVQDKNGLTLLRKEVDVMKTLSQGKHIVKYYDSHAERLADGTYQVLVLMELCPNKSLLDYMNSKIKTMLTEEEILKIMNDISLGIYDMHALKLIHRDIKIENVLIDANHVFKLCDFGSTSTPMLPPKDQREFQLLSHDILYQTTPQYRAPEMIDLYRGFAIDEKADIWALGCFLYKLCYYTTPFEKNGDIAILHASFQFPQAPSFSGDLKNLMIIMLQESPVFRPNIVQVIMLITKMLKSEPTGTEDFYNAGPYNFQALHEYQRQKQQELLKQQNYYFQQQQAQKKIASQGSSLPTHTSSLSLHEQELEKRNSRYSVHSNDSLRPLHGSIKLLKSSEGRSRHQSAERSHSRHQSTEGPIEVKEEITNNSDDASFSDFDQLENVEERYPSLDELVIGSAPDHEDSTTTRHSYSHSDLEEKSQRQAQQHLARKSFESTEYEKKETWEKLQSTIDAEAQKLADDIFSESQPKVEDRNKFQADTHQQIASDKYQNPEKFQQNKVEFDKYQQSAAEKYHDTADKYLQGNIDKYQTTTDQFQNNVDKYPPTTEKSLNNVDPQYKPGKPYEPKTNNLRPTTGVHVNLNSHSKLPILDATRDEFSVDKSTEDSDRIPTSDSEDIFEINRSKSLDIQNAFPNSSDFTLAKSLPATLNPGLEPVPVVAPQNVLDISSQLGSSNYPQSNVHIAPAYIPSHGQIPGHIASVQGQPPSSGIQSSVQAINSNPFPLKPAEIKSTIPQVEERKNANPWGDYRAPSTTSTPLTKPSTSTYKQSEIPAIQLQDHLSALNLNDGLISIEPNLIDLEVGLESSSSSSATPILLPKTHIKKNIDIGSQTSLLDLNEESEAPKKRIASIQIPSNISFQEEVVDFASDDENPENSSKMSRLSIRHSLKKPKSRQSGEQKRSDSSSSDKKRLSFFGGTN